MKSPNVWIPISLFCERTYWPDLLTKGIQQFADMLQQERKLIHYYIAFNSERGNNIRFVILANRSDAKETAMYADYYFKSYFSKIQHTSPATTGYAGSLLMNFPVNSVQYGLFEQLPEPAHPYYDPALQQALSAVLIECANNALITDETIIMSAFHLYLTLHAVISARTHTTMDDLMQAAMRSLSTMNGPAPAIACYDQMSFNKEQLFDMAYDLVKQTETLPDWCKQWRQLCNSHLHIPAFYEKISYFIDTQLGLCASMKFSALQLIKQCATIYSPIDQQLDFIYACQLSPAVSEVIFLYKDRSFKKGQLFDRHASLAADYQHLLQQPHLQHRYHLQGMENNGSWSNPVNEHGMNFQSEQQEVFILKTIIPCRYDRLRDAATGRIFYQVNDPGLIRQLVQLNAAGAIAKSADSSYIIV